MLKALINGQRAAQVSVSDRGLLYGQSVFETISVYNGQARLLDLHLERLDHACAVFGIPFDRTGVLDDIQQLVVACNKGVLRISQTMGVGGRGYLNPDKPEPSRISTLHEYPNHPADNWVSGINLGMVDFRLARQRALAGLKHSNRLEQVIARSQWQAGWQEALVRDTDDNVIEGTQSNVFIRLGDVLLTPSLEHSGVAGVMREHIIQQLDELGIELKIVSLSLADIEAADEIFLSNSVIGLWPVNAFLGNSYSDFKTSHKLLKLMIKNEVIPPY